MRHGKASSIQTTLQAALRVAEDYLVNKADLYENVFRMRAKAGRIPLDSRAVNGGRA